MVDWIDGEGQQQFDNRPAKDSQWQYEYDAWGNLIKKSNEREKHLYTWDLLHRLKGYEKQTPAGTVTQARYQYDPYGRRISKTVRRNNQSDTTRYGWDGDRLVLTQTSNRKVYTLHEPGSFTPLLRIESDGGDEPYTSLADKLQQHSQIPFTAQEYADMERLEEDLRTGTLSERSRNWLEFANVPAHLMAAQLDPQPLVNIRNIHLYQCDHRGTPTALINREGQTEWKAEVDPWGELLSEENPHNIEQPLRLPGQWYDEESGLHYNRHRYYDPQQGRYITQDPIGLKGGWNWYVYPLNPVMGTDPLGLEVGWGGVLGDGGGRYAANTMSMDLEMSQSGASAQDISQSNQRMCIGANGWNPGNQYTKGIVFGSTAIGIGGLGVGAAIEDGIAAGVTKISLGCAKSAGEKIIENKLENKSTPLKEIVNECVKGAVDSGLDELGSFAFDTSIDNLPN